jgi:hypothetical protein
MAFGPTENIKLDWYTELLTPEHFLEMYKHDRDNIESASPVLAPLDSKMFGYILVKKKRPRHPLLPPELLNE